MNKIILPEEGKSTFPEAQALSLVDDKNTIDEFFPLAGKEDCYTQQDLEDLLKRAVIHKLKLSNNSGQALQEEALGDSPTFFQTVKVDTGGTNFFSMGITNFSNLSLSALALGIISYYVMESRRDRADFLRPLLIWKELKEDLQAGKVDAYKLAERKLRRLAGLSLEDVPKFDVSDYSDDFFWDLCVKHTEGLSNKVKQTLVSPKAHFKEVVKKIPQYIKGFFYNAVNNYSEPLKFRTPKAVVNGAISTVKLVKLWAEYTKGGLDPFQRRLYTLKKQYKNSPVDIEHWDRTFNAQKDLQTDFLMATAGSVVMPIILKFMYGNAEMAMTENWSKAMNGDYGGIVTNAFCFLLSVGPLRNVGMNLQKYNKTISSKRAKMTDDYYLVHADMEKLAEHDNVQNGFRDLAM